MFLRDFQLCLRKHDFDLYKRCREQWAPTELRVRMAIPKRFNFGNVKKVVLELGPDSTPTAHYRVLLDVGLLHHQAFDATLFLAKNAVEQQREINSIIATCMHELAGRFNAPIDWLTPALDVDKDL